MISEVHEYVEEVRKAQLAFHESEVILSEEANKQIQKSEPFVPKGDFAANLNSWNVLVSMAALYLEDNDVKVPLKRKEEET